ncbi:MAG TPA: MobF family relaxase [Verrucomicrobiae bacterium]|jgi:conjugative relaxase-like TrwC/TraI family protein|nr:MobF family relaxase [Verrucomicrobiae bacterium]
MFSAVAHKNQAGAEGYFVEHLSQNDYYAAGEIQPGQWIGAGAERLGLNEQVTREQFYALCQNQHPQTGEQLTLRQNAKDERRVFFDFTCSAPKSVSVLAVTMDDKRLVAAHEEAAKIAFRELETFAATRVRKHGSQRDRSTGNLTAATFLHNSSRALDPQLHTHFTVFNATFDKQENCWKALQAGAMYEAVRYATAVYRNELAKRVYEIGFRITPVKHGFEIEGMSHEVLRRFSKRSQQRDAVVHEMEQKLGRKLSNNEVAYAVHRSRAPKLKGISTAEVRERQLAQLSPEDLQSLRRVSKSARIGRILSNSNNESKMLAHAVAHVFERKSVAPEHELLAVALAHRQGEVDLPRLKQALRASPELIPTPKGFSTKKVLETELFLIETVNAGRDAVAPLHLDFQPADWLGDDQRQAILHVLNANDRITGLRGLAGTGKTTALRELVIACKATRIEPLFCAPTAAGTDVLRKEGFNAVTLQSLLFSKQQLSTRNLIVLDEAGAVGIDDMKRLFDLAKDCRVVLSGDTGQHASVTRGDALRILEQHSSLASGQLTRIRRQRRAEYRHAVELAAQKRTTESFAQLERMDAVAEFSSNQIYDSAAQSYLKSRKQNKSSLLVAPTWTEIEAVTEKVRAELKSSGVIGGEEKEFQVFDSLSWTEAQKRDARQYRAGQKLNFHRAAHGLSKGDSAEVVQVSDDSLKLRRPDGSEASVQLGRGSAAFDVGETRTLKIAAGDKLLLQANWRKKFINGELVEAKSVQGDSILLVDGRIIPSDYRTFTHGYAVTSHAAQGKTVDEVLVVASSRSLAAINQQQFYVSISRGRERCQVFTDDKDLLRSHVTHSNARIAAVEVVPSAAMKRHKFIRQILQWSERVRELMRLNPVKQRHTEVIHERRGIRI